MPTLEDIINSTNVVDLLDNTTLDEIGASVVEHYTIDRESRADWEDKYDKWMAMAGQVAEHKNKPWPGCANILYPLLPEAALQFNARAVPALMPNAEPVGAGPVGPDPQGEKTPIAKAVAAHMNYQLITEMEEWEDDFDKLLLAVSITGLEYKKNYFDATLRRNVSRHVSPRNLVINYYADSMSNARKTEIHRWNRNYIMEKIAAGYFAKVDWDNHPTPHSGKETENEQETKNRVGQEEPPREDRATPYTVLEYHGWLDLDEDGYEEPYIITVFEDSEYVLQIVPRFNAEDVEIAPDGTLIRIQPYESYIKYGFIPSFDGSFYPVGFGHILYPINAVVNTTINQITDAGTLSNMNGGFVSRGVRLRGGIFNASPGKWTSVNTTGDDLRKGVVPFPVREPSQVLMSLMTYLVEAAQKLSSTTDIFTGEHPGQNTKAGVTQAVLQEGQRVFTAIYKRIRRSLKRELDSLFKLNAVVLESGEADSTLIARSAQIFGVTAEMYNTENLVIQPSADPNTAIKEQRLQKDQIVLQTIASTGIGSLAEAEKRFFETLEIERIELLIPEGSEKAPDPKAQIDKAKIQLQADVAEFESKMEQQKFALDAEIERGKLAIEEYKAKMDVLRMDMQNMQAGTTAGLALQKLEDDMTLAREANNAKRTEGAN